MTRRRKKGTGKKRIFFLVVITVVCAVAAYLFFAPSGERQEEPPSPPAVRTPEEPVAGPAPEALDTSGAKKWLAIIIDDIGYDLSAVERLLDMEIPVTFAILPHSPRSLEAAERVHAAGRDILLHMPMEPQGYPEKDPGEGALFLAMTREELEAQVERNLEAVPYIAGVNNHMGSRFMEDAAMVEAVLGLLKARNLFFVDSMTTSRSKGSAVAKKVGIGRTRRDVFIDNGCNLKETSAILDNIINSRDDWTSLVLIGHPHDSTIEALEQAASLFGQKGIRVVPVSCLIGQ